MDPQKRFCHNRDDRISAPVHGDLLMIIDWTVSVTAPRGSSHSGSLSANTDGAGCMPQSSRSPESLCVYLPHADNVYFEVFLTVLRRTAS
jgi:hypothetical protein